MTTISVPLPENLLSALEMLVAQGIVPNKAEGLRQALRQYLEDQAVEAVLKASKEPRLEGDIDELAEKISI